MVIGIHKPEQGYWVRMLTAVFAGVLVAGGAAWCWAQAANIPIPKAYDRVVLDVSAGTLDPGSAPAIRWADGPEEAAEVIAFAPRPGRGQQFEAQIRLRSDDVAFSNGDRISSGEAFAATVVSATPVDAVPRTYVQGGLAMVAILLGAALIYWFVALSRPTVDFLIATDGEMKKVNWSSFAEVRGSTIVVIVAALLIASMIFVIDIVFKVFFTWIGVLEG